MIREKEAYTPYIIYVQSPSQQDTMEEDIMMQMSADFPMCNNAMKGNTHNRLSLQTHDALLIALTLL